MGNESKFDGVAGKYAKYRPSYSSELIDYLYNQVGFGGNDGNAIIDVGAGTGIFTKLLLERASPKIKIYCVEPNTDMIKAAREFLSEYPNCEFIECPAEKIALPDRTADFITAAQAFHWFDADAFKSECKRLLKNGGKVAIVWNSKAEPEQTSVFDEIASRYCPNFKRNKRVDHAGFFKDGVFERVVYKNDYCLDEEEFIGESLSKSYAPREADGNFKPYVGELRSAFGKYSVGGILTIPNITECFIGEV